MLARGEKGGFQQAPGFGACFCRVHLPQPIINLMVVLVHALELAVVAST